MKFAAVVVVSVLGVATCSLEPAGYRPPSSRYLPPTNSYLAPTGNSRPAPPSTSYGLPDYRVTQQQQHPHYPRQHSKADEQHEAARYDFGYQVRDNRGNDYGHQEAREGTATRGSYYVLLPDGRRQIVEYVADAEGYKPRISYEAAGNDRRSAALDKAYLAAPY